MEDPERDQLLEAMEKLIQLQLLTVTKVAKLQALCLVMRAQISGMQVSSGVPLEEVSKQTEELFDQRMNEILGGLNEWLRDHDIAEPEGDDPWWDQPGKG